MIFFGSTWFTKHQAAQISLKCDASQLTKHVSLIAPIDGTSCLHYSKLISVISILCQNTIFTIKSISYIREYVFPLPCPLHCTSKNMIPYGKLYHDTSSSRLFLESGRIWRVALWLHAIKLHNQKKKDKEQQVHLTTNSSSRFHGIGLLARSNFGHKSGTKAKSEIFCS